MFYSLRARISSSKRKRDGRIALTPVTDREAERRAMDLAYERVLAIGAPADGVQARDPFEFIERPGLE